MNHVVLIVDVVVMFLFSILFGIYLFIQISRMAGWKSIANVKTRLESLPVRIEEVILFLGISVVGLFLISRVLKGQCPPGTSLWEQQTCNPFASLGGIPTDLAYALYMAPMVFPFSNDLSIRTLVISQLSTLAIVLFCVIYSKAWSDYYVVLNWLIFSNFSFEFVRLQRVAFQENINAMDLHDEGLRKAQEVHLLKEEQERSR